MLIQKILSISIYRSNIQSFCEEDGILSGLIKRYRLVKEILYICNKKLIEGKKPEWPIINVKPIPKSNALFKGCNYGGKSHTKYILNRIRPAIEPHLRRNQNGFRSGRITSQIYLP